MSNYKTEINKMYKQTLLSLLSTVIECATCKHEEKEN